MKYDVIVVGAGSAGCVLATRLSENPARSVLLLEAGPDYPSLEQIPNELKYNWGEAASAPNTPHNWSFTGQPVFGQSRTAPAPRGRVVGGTGAINHMIFLRGIPQDFDGWAAQSNPEWAYLKVLSYFRKSETDADIRDDFHGTGGPMPVRRHARATWDPFQAAFYEACLSAGFPHDPDLNGPETGGVGAIPLNNPGGVRTSAAIAYLNPNRHRLNVTVRGNVAVRRILFRGSRAVGVEAESGGERFTVEGSEIILSAGAIGSPHLLLLSGVGPAEQLLRAGVPVVQDLPGVGQNLRNHPSAAVRVRITEGYVKNPDVPRNQAALRFTAPGSPDRNDLQIAPTSTGPAGEPATEFRIGCRLELPDSAGQVTLASADPYASPRIEYQSLKEARDRARLREVIRTCAHLLQHQAFKGILAQRLNPADADLNSDASLDAWLLKTAGVAHHASGSCKLGPDSDPLAVVDQYCRVRGIEGLRVVDASVMPNVTRANTHATTIMIAERVADWMK